MLVFYYTEPVLEIRTEEDGKRFGLHHERNPDVDWSELRHSLMDERCKDILETSDLRQILLEDLAYTYGSNTLEFTKKLEEFKFI